MTKNKLSSGVGELLKQLPGMAEVEERVRSKFVSDAPLLEEIPHYLLTLGGKRIRPALCLLTAQLCGEKDIPEELIDVASGIELIHMATLLHDDIIDNSPIRRGKTSPHIEFGESNTLLAGDFLLVRAFSLCARLDNFIVEETEEACIRLTEGEILEAPLVKRRCNLEQSLDIAEKKTAALFGLAALSGGHIAGASKDAVLELKKFGIEIGIAFQILDDILDVIADEDLLGKKCGGDLIERKPSVINVLWLDSGDPLAEKVLLCEEPAEESLRKEAIEKFREPGNEVVEKARQLAEERIRSAQAALKNTIECLGGNSNVDAEEILQMLLSFTLKRLR